MELKQKAKLSSRTLDKHLDKLAKFDRINKTEQVINGKHAVLFKATPEAITLIETEIERRELINMIEPILDEQKNPLTVLWAIEQKNKLTFIRLLDLIQQEKNITDEAIRFNEEIFLWPDYEQLTAKLIEASRKIINDIDISQLWKDQTQREIDMCEFLKRQPEYNNSKNNSNP